MDFGDLKPKIRGDVIDRNDTRYEEARKLYNGMIDKKPSVIVRCVDAADVMASVNFARDNGLTLAIRGGGHNGPGLGSCDDGLVIDLSRMRSVRVDPATKMAEVAGGCLWGDVDHATHAFGMAVPAGFISSTGVGGLTLGGGIGYLTRQYGLTIDHLKSVDMVLADGSFVTANEKDQPDLYWAVRGGGGNFGVVTQFTFDMVPAAMVMAGPTFWDLQDAAAIIQKFDEFIETAPREINGFFAFLVVPPVPLFPDTLHGKAVCGIVWCSTADSKRTEQLMAPTAKWPKPLFQALMPLPLPALNSFFDPLYPQGLQWYWKADFFNSLPQPAIRAHVQFGSALPTMLSTMHLYPVNGAVHDTGSSETAFHFRKSKLAEVIVGVGADPSNNNALMQWARDYWSALHPYAAEGAYVNFMMDEGQARIEATYGNNYARLQQVKARYDPANLFCVNQNITPAMAAGR